VLNPDYRDILSIFNEEKVEYLVIGAYALAAHGLPRATGDIDLWINRDERNAGRVWRSLVKFGAPLSDLKESDFSGPGMVYQIGVAPNRIDILTSIDGVEFNDAWRQRVEINIEDVLVFVISRVHLIANKKTVGRPQDLADIDRLEKETSKS
jgi:hypothetical protein